MKPNDITRAIIDATVDRGLREIEEDPKRSIRKLADMGKQFSKGRFVQDLYTLFQELLRNDDSPYYTAIEHLLRNTERKGLKDFGINIGYGSLTYGARQIRSNEKTRDYQIPWLPILRLNPASPPSVEAETLERMVRQGTSLGIYSYAIRSENDFPDLQALTGIFRKYSKCGFILFLPDRRLSLEHLARLKPCTNIMTLFPAGGSSTDQNIRGMQRHKALYGIYAYYEDSDGDSWTSQNRFQEFSSYESSFVLMIPRDNCSKSYQDRIDAYIRSARIQQLHPFILLNIYSDAYQIDRSISSEPCFFELMEDGSIHTQEGVLKGSYRSQPLERMFAAALPKKEF